MINKIPSSPKKPVRESPRMVKCSARSVKRTSPEMQHYFEERVRKTLRLNVVALKLAGLLKK